MEKPHPDLSDTLSARHWAWLPLAAAVVIGLVWLILAFGQADAVQDDVRQHVAWLEAMRDPELFRGDFIASFFVSSNTPLFKGFYWLPAQAGISPLVMAKLYPVALTLLTAWLAWRFFLTTGIGGLAAALGAVLFVQGIWASDDIASATARAFSWPMLLAVLVCWRERRFLPGAGLGVVLALTYPSAAVFAGAMIGLAHLPDLRGRPAWPELRQRWAGPALIIAGMAAGAVFLLATGTAKGMVSLAEARAMVEFGPKGRTSFFGKGPLSYWLFSKRSGAMPETALRHAVLVVAAVAALVTWRRLPGTLKHMVLAAALAGFLLWAAAHLLLFRLYLPARFPLMGLRLALALLAGAGLAAWLLHLGERTRRAAVAALLAVPLLALAVPLKALNLINLPDAPTLMQALRSAPKDALVAGFSPDLDNIPSDVQRRVLTAREFHLPYNRAYVREMRARLGDTAQAVFADGPEGVRVLAARYGVTHLLIDRVEVTPEGVAHSWWRPILAQEGRLPACSAEACRVWALEPEQRRCVVAEDRQQTLLSVACLVIDDSRPQGE